MRGFWIDTKAQSLREEIEEEPDDKYELVTDKAHTVTNCAADGQPGTRGRIRRHGCAASIAQGSRQRAYSAGLNHLAVFMLVVSVLFLAPTVADRSLSRA